MLDPFNVFKQIWKFQIQLVDWGSFLFTQTHSEMTHQHRKLWELKQVDLKMLAACTPILKSTVIRLPILPDKGYNKLETKNKFEFNHTD